MAWCSSESRNKTKQLFVFPWMCCWLNWPGRVLQNFIPLTKHPAKKKRDTGLNGHNLLDRSQEHPMQISEPLGLPFHTPSLHPFAIKFRFNPNTECHCKLFIKTQSNGQWKTSWFFFFLLFVGSRAGHGRIVTNGVSLGWKLSLYLWVGFLAYSGWKCLAFKATAARFSKVRSLVFTRQGHHW